MGRTLDLSQMSNERKPSCLGHIGDEKTTEFYGDYNKPL